MLSKKRWRFVAGRLSFWAISGVRKKEVPARTKKKGAGSLGRTPYRYVWEDVEVSLQDEGVGVGVGGVEGGNRVVE